MAQVVVILNSKGRRFFLCDKLDLFSKYEDGGPSGCIMCGPCCALHYDSHGLAG